MADENNQVKLPAELRQKLQELKTFNKSVVTTEEFHLLIAIETDELANHDDRLLCAKTLWQICENQLHHIHQITEQHKSRFLELEHKKQEDRYINKLADDVKSVPMDQLVAALRHLIDKAEDK